MTIEGMRLLATAVLLSAVAGCSPEPAPTPRPALAEADTDEVRAALLRYVYEQGLRDAPAERQVTCIKVENWTDPSAQLLSILSGVGLKVRKGSQCNVEYGWVVEPASNLRGAMVTVESVRMVGRGRAEGAATCLWGRMAGISVTCALEFQFGRWRVVQETGRVRI